MMVVRMDGYSVAPTDMKMVLLLAVMMVLMTVVLMVVG